MGFKVGDKVALKPNQSSEDEVLTHLRYGEVYEVARVIVVPDEWDEFAGDDNTRTITLVGQDCHREWLERRFQLAAVARPERGDVIEVTVRAKVAAVQSQGVPVPIVYFDNAGNDPEDYVGPVYLNGGVQALTIVEPAKPKLDLRALPEGTVVQAPTGEVYVKRDAANHLHYGGSWPGVDGSTLSSAALAARHSELVELVPKGSAASV